MAAQVHACEFLSADLASAASPLLVGPGAGWGSVTPPTPLTEPPRLPSTRNPAPWEPPAALNSETSAETTRGNHPRLEEPK